MQRYYFWFSFFYKKFAPPISQKTRIVSCWYFDKYKYLTFFMIKSGNSKMVSCHQSILTQLATLLSIYASFTKYYSVLGSFMGDYVIFCLIFWLVL